MTPFRSNSYKHKIWVQGKWISRSGYFQENNDKSPDLAFDFSMQFCNSNQKFCKIIRGFPKISPCGLQHVCRLFSFCLVTCVPCTHHPAYCTFLSWENDHKIAPIGTYTGTTTHRVTLLNRSAMGMALWRKAKRRLPSGQPTSACCTGTIRPN